MGEIWVGVRITTWEVGDSAVAVAGDGLVATGMAVGDGDSIAELAVGLGVLPVPEQATSMNTNNKMIGCRITNVYL